MSIRKIIDWAIQDAATTQKGNIASPFFQLYDNSGGWVWACDVDLGGGEDNVLKSVPVASNNREIIYAEEGKAVNLSKLNNSKWVITGLSKSLNSTIHFIYVSLDEDIFQINRKLLVGYVTRLLTYGELGTTVTPYGYGNLPYGIRGKFDLDGNLVKLVENY